MKDKDKTCPSCKCFRFCEIYARDKRPSAAATCEHFYISDWTQEEMAEFVEMANNPPPKSPVAITNSNGKRYGDPLKFQGADDAVAN